MLINKKKRDELTPDLQAFIKYACWAEIIGMTGFSANLESKAEEELVAKHGVHVMRTTDDVLQAQLEATDEVFELEAEKNRFFAKVLNSQREFAKRAVPYAQRIGPPLATVVQHYWRK